MITSTRDSGSEESRRSKKRLLESWRRLHTKRVLEGAMQVFLRFNSGVMRMSTPVRL